MPKNNYIHLREQHEFMMMEKVHLDESNKLPYDYHCDCKYCKKYMGMLRRTDGTFYSKMDRRKYYSDGDAQHIAKTPLHMARWCIQTYTEEGDWVLDPTMGAGTTAIESLSHNRNVVGIELEFYEVIMQNIDHLIGLQPDNEAHYRIIQGDARKIAEHLEDFKHKFQLIVNNPPYSGDEQQVGNIKTGKTKSLRYDTSKNNLAFLKEQGEYYDTIHDIYSKACEFLKVGGYLCIGVKDMIRNKAPYLLHKFLGNVINHIDDMYYQGLVLLPHYPPTLFMSTYNKRFPDVKVPKYQTILIFKKEG